MTTSSKTIQWTPRPFKNSGPYIREGAVPELTIFLDQMVESGGAGLSESWVKQNMEY